MVKSLDEQIKSLQERQAQLKARENDLMARRRERERRARTKRLCCPARRRGWRRWPRSRPRSGSRGCTPPAPARAAWG
ncbi:hypothetical protein GBC30_11040 [Bifidobacterium longum]|nr:hypothetical protein GBC30_11040 [Bifidobacterium longum]